MTYKHKSGEYCLLEEIMVSEPQWPIVTHRLSDSKLQNHDLHCPCAAKNVLAYLKDNDIQIMSPAYYVHCYSLILLFRPSPTSLTVKLQHITVSEPRLSKRPSVWISTHHINCIWQPLLFTFVTLYFFYFMVVCMPGCLLELNNFARALKYKLKL